MRHIRTRQKRRPKVSHDGAGYRVAVVSWHVGKDGLQVWREGILVATIPPEQHLKLVAALAAEMVKGAGE